MIVEFTYGPIYKGFKSPKENVKYFNATETPIEGQKKEYRCKIFGALIR